MPMRLLSFASAIEVIVGVVLIADPSLVGSLLFGQDLSSVAVAVGRVAGFGLAGLGCACWPSSAEPSGAAVRGLFVYNALAAIFFIVLGVGRELAGVLMWPAAVLHLVLAVLLAVVLVRRSLRT